MVFLKHLLKTLLIIVTLFIAAHEVQEHIESKNQPIRIVQKNEQISDSHFIISEHLLLGKLQTKSQIVSMEQKLDEIKKTDVDKSWLGERQTTLTIDEGSFKMGLETKDIEIKHIDQENGNVYIKLGKPILISLNLPYDHVDIDKSKGWARLSMNEEEQKMFYKSVEKSVQMNLMKDEEILNQANLNNQRVIKELLINLPGVNDIIFSEEGQL